MAYHLIFNECGNGKTIFNDDFCFTQPSALANTILAISNGYLMFDFIIIFVEIKDFSLLGIQNIVHHLIALTATFSALMVGGYNPMVAAATTFTEVSTVFLHIRFYMIKSKNADGTPFIVVMLIFIFLFAYSRMFVQFRLAFRMFSVYNSDTTTNLLQDRHSLVPFFQYICLAMMVALQCLNCWWFM